MNAEAVLVRRAALRLGVHAAVLASAIVVLLSGAAVAVVVSCQDNAAAVELDAAVTHADDVGDPPAGMWLALGDPGGPTAVTSGAPTGLPDEAQMARVAASGLREAGVEHVGGVDYRTDTVRHADGTVVQGMLDLTANHAMRDRLVLMLLAAGGAGLVLSAVAGTWLGRRALRPLAAALAVQRRFVADAGHELRTPVTLLNTRAQLLRRRLRAAGTEDRELADVDGVVADSARLGEVLEDLLIVSDPVATRPREPVDLAAVARDVLDAVGPQAGEQGVRLVGPEPAGPAPYVEGSAVALRRAITALLDNAVRHAAHEVVATVTTHGDEVRLDVADDGPGIAPELAPRLFERFAMGRPVSGERRRRYGLGLALAAEIVAAHSGRIELVDDARPGAVVRVRLPGLCVPRNL
jgi:two-component system, OmpR family, sensor kinase